MHALDWMMQTSIPEPFQPSPSFLAVVEKGFESEYEGHSMNMKQQTKLQGLSVSSPHRSVSTEKDRNGSSNSGIARIKVVVCLGFFQRNLCGDFWSCLFLFRVLGHITITLCGICEQKYTI
jgi:hypothetical protein